MRSLHQPPCSPKCHPAKHQTLSTRGDVWVVVVVVGTRYISLDNRSIHPGPELSKGTVGAGGGGGGGAGVAIKKQRPVWGPLSLLGAAPDGPPGL
eukprot:COSAG04_NODE_440_length_14411_cov_40.575112_17_plen_94_part_01